MFTFLTPDGELSLSGRISIALRPTLLFLGIESRTGTLFLRMQVDICKEGDPWEMSEQWEAILFRKWHDSEELIRKN